MQTRLTEDSGRTPHQGCSLCPLWGPRAAQPTEPKQTRLWVTTLEPWGLILKTSWSSYLVETLELHRGGALGQPLGVELKVTGQEQGVCPPCFGFVFPQCWRSNAWPHTEALLSLTRVGSNLRQIHTGWGSPGQQSPSFSFLCQQVVSIAFPSRCIPIF